jgi:hypothetical protein
MREQGVTDEDVVTEVDEAARGRRFEIVQAALRREVAARTAWEAKVREIEACLGMGSAVRVHAWAHDLAADTDEGREYDAAAAALREVHS